MENIFSNKITKSQSIDTGMAMVLILLLLGLYFEEWIWIKYALVLLLLAMITPMAFKYIAFLWLGLSKLMGFFMSRLVLSLIFFVLVVPVGFLRRAMGRDPLKLKQFKKSTVSVMVTRNQTFTKEMTENPY